MPIKCHQLPSRNKILRRSLTLFWVLDFATVYSYFNVQNCSYFIVGNKIFLFLWKNESLLFGGVGKKGRGQYFRVGLIASRTLCNILSKTSVILEFFYVFPSPIALVFSMSMLSSRLYGSTNSWMVFVFPVIPCWWEALGTRTDCFCIWADFHHEDGRKDMTSNR